MKDVIRYVKYPIETQNKIFNYLIENGKNTAIGSEFNFSEINSIDSFQKNLPIQKYENLKPYIERILKKKEKNVLWNTPVKWFAMSSGTTDDKSKYIPVTRESLRDCHYKGGRQMLSVYIDRHPETNFIFGKSLILGGSQQVNTIGNDIFTGDISSILITKRPFYIKYSCVPDLKTVLISDWEEKIEKLAKNTINENVTNMAGVPSWILVLLKYIENYTNKTIPEIWPNMEVFFHGGVSFTPYKEQYEKIIPIKNMNYWEVYNASEGFFGFQYSNNNKDMILILDNGIFYEFISSADWDKENPKVVPLEAVEIGINYAIVITTNGGLWRYQIGDTIEFTSKTPYLFKFTGRTKLFINAFGEELIIDNAEKALSIACKKNEAIVSEFTAAPIYIGDKNKGSHEWLIEFEKYPNDIKKFTRDLDNALKLVNSDYEAKRSHNLTMLMPQIITVKKGTFYNWLKSKNKLGGQNKVPSLSNDRKHIEDIKKFIL